MRTRLLLADGDLLAAQVEQGVKDDQDSSLVQDVVTDLELATIWQTMAQGDPLIATVSAYLMMRPLTDVDAVRYRQAALDDVLRDPEPALALYRLAGEGIEAEKQVYRSFFSEYPERRLRRGVRTLWVLVAILRQLREVAEVHADSVRSTAWRNLFSALSEELAEDYLAEVTEHLNLLRFKDGLLLSARIGSDTELSDLVLRVPQELERSLFGRLRLPKPTSVYTVPDRDESGQRALGELRDRAVTRAAEAVAVSADHVLGFLHSLRHELAFFLGWVNLRRRLDDIGVAQCLPDPHEVGSDRLTVRGVVDTALALQAGAPPVPNDVEADGARVVVITGANQGGKSTMLRALGQAQLMLGAGGLVSAGRCAAALCPGVRTHFKREEDPALRSGKLEEELRRMQAVARQLCPGWLLLSNESFSATNEREGSQIAREVVVALADAGVRVCAVTHLFDFASGLRTEARADVVFLRAERGSGNDRPFRVVPGEPLPTSFGRDVYEKVFAHAGGARGGLSRPDHQGCGDGPATEGGDQPDEQARRDVGERLDH